jgi:aspartate 1-decarboxylase
VILISYGVMDTAEAAVHRPRVVFVNEANEIVDRGSVPAYVPDGHGLVSGAETIAETVDAAMLDALLQAER